MLKGVKVLKSPALLIILAILSGCAKNDSDKKDIVAYVNKEPIYVSELQREVAHRARVDPLIKITPETEYDQLTSIIDKKIIIQAAMNEGLARKEKFVNTIKNFWEQTLIRDFIDSKTKELQDYVFVTEEEINKYYDNLSTKVTFKILKDKDKALIGKAYKKYLNDKDTSNWETIGPVSYEDIESSELLNAFPLNKGSVQKFDDGYNYYLVAVEDKEKVDVPTLTLLRADIEKRITALKEKQLFENWLKKERKKTWIKINDKLLK